MSSAGVLRRLPSLLLAQGHRGSAISYATASSKLIYTGINAQQYGDSNRQGYAFVLAAASLLGVGAVGTVTSAADAPTLIEVADDPYARPAEAHPLPSKITLYQYEICPYCCKVRAFLDFYKLPYEVIEVNPLTKGELKWSSYKKVPVVKLDDEIVADSSAIMSRLATDVAAARPAPLRPTPQAKAAQPPLPPAPAAKRTSSWWPFGGGSSSSSSSSGGGGLLDAGSSASAGPGAKGAPAPVETLAQVDVLQEEVRWRKWVDEKLVKVLTANIYRNWDESVETFKYITEQTGWSWGAREVARWTGAVMMWQIGKRMPTKYGIEGDLRLALYDTANDFVDNALCGRRFAGGDSPNLADLSAFGVIRAVRKTGAFRDLMANSRLGPWFTAMEEAVGGSARINAGPGDIA